MSDTNILACAHCEGSGLLNNKACQFCGGKGWGVWRHNRFLFWNYFFDTQAVAERQAKIKWGKITNVILGLVILAGAAGFVFTRSYVWLAIILAIGQIIISRKARAEKIFTEVAAHAYIDDVGEPERAITWEEARRLPITQLQNMATCTTPELLQVLESAYASAVAHQAMEVTRLHLARALTEEKRIQSLFLRLLIPPKDLQSAFEKIIPTNGAGGVSVVPAISGELWQALLAGYEEAWSARSPVLDATDVLLVVVAAEQKLQDILFDFGVTPAMLKNAVAWVRVREQMKRQHTRQVRGSHGRSRKGDTNRAMTAIATPFLNSLSHDLTKSALFGALEPMIGRDHEIESVFRVLQSGSTGVLLVGNRGVGVNAIINGIAELMVGENVPSALHDKRLVELDISRLLAGASPADAQDRLLTLLYELERAGNIVLVISGVEKLIGAEVGSAQGLDVAGVLATELGKGNFLTIATTTPEAYQKAIASQALGAVFQKVEIEEMSADAAVQVLEAKSGYIEYKNNVWFSYEALEKAVALAARYLHDSFLPENAIEVITEAALMVRTKRGKDQIVRAEDVAAIVGEKSKIPVTAVNEDEGAKLMRLETEMHRRVIGQEEAVTLVANALRRARAEIRAGKRPIANFLFLGPTGVGKTELAKTIAEVYFGSEQNMIRLDMSEFQDASALYRLIGQPGQQGTGMLAEAVRQKPFSLVLLDELEKADPNILNLFLQIMDDGRLTDSVGRVIDFTNVILLATSNAGTSYVQEQVRAGATSDHIKNQLIHGELKQNFRPEFLNRFDAIVLFQPLTQPQIESIARLILAGMGKKLEERGIFLEVTDAAVASLAEAGFDPEFGARPLRRVIQDKIENAIAGLLLQNTVKRKDTIVVDVNGVTVRPPAEV